jgi:hypothetical protein
MKHTKSILAALVAALSVGAASATTTKTNGAIGDQINIAGSTAMKYVSMPAIQTYASNNGYTLVAGDALPNPGALALFTKVVTATNGSTVTITTNAINVHFIGSEGGTLVTASKTTQPFYPLNASGKTAGDTTVNGLVHPDPACTQLAYATVTFSDVNQAVGRFAAGSKTSPVKTVALTEYSTGLNAVNFAFTAATNFPGSNITDQVARELFSVGHVPLSHITGVASDSNSTVYVTGRDVDSGTRSLAFIETGFGLLSSANQYMLDTNSGSLVLTPAGMNVFNGISYTTGNGGYFSGGDLCKAVKASAALTNGYLVGYAGAKDVIGNSVALNYNGVTPYTDASHTNAGFQTNNNGIANGSYSLWSIEHLYYNLANAPKGTVAADITALVNSVGAAIQAKTTAQLGYGFTAMGDLNVKRSANEGSTIISK